MSQKHDDGRRRRTLNDVDIDLLTLTERTTQKQTKVLAQFSILAAYIEPFVAERQSDKTQSELTLTFDLLDFPAPQASYWTGHG